MNSIVFKDVYKSYGDAKIVKSLNLEIKEGERLILLGPSGCGKSTTLRMIAGLEEITSGELVMGGRVVNDVPPGERNVAMVFQSYALFPHLSVWDNIAFGLKIQKLGEDEIKRRTTEALKILNLQGYENRKPKDLSGGQKQRVALCRALVKQSPYFLLDEPLSNLDAQLRQQARTELVRIHEIYKPTMIYVTHDQIEAMTVANRIVVMRDGVLQQAGFIGSPAMNIVSGYYSSGKLKIGDVVSDVPELWQKILAGHTNVLVGIRPEHLKPAADGKIKGCVSYQENTGNQRTVTVNVNGETVFVTLPGVGAEISGNIGLDFNWDEVSLFNAETKENIGYVQKGEIVR